MQPIIFMVKVSLALAVCSSGWSLAREVVPDDVRQRAEVVTNLSIIQTTPFEVSGWGTPMVSSELDGYRGGFDLVKNDMQLNGSVTNNSAVNIMTGHNSIADGAFTNASGFPMVIQNSGSNVLIQNATIINVQFR